MKLSSSGLHCARCLFLIQQNCPRPLRLEFELKNLFVHPCGLPLMSIHPRSQQHASSHRFMCLLVNHLQTKCTDSKCLVGLCPWPAHYRTNPNIECMKLGDFRRERAHDATRNTEELLPDVGESRYMHDLTCTTQPPRRCVVCVHLRADKTETAYSKGTPFGGHFMQFIPDVTHKAYTRRR